MKVVAIVGMAGAGKSEVAHAFESNGFTRIRFGDVTDEEQRQAKEKWNRLAQGGDSKQKDSAGKDARCG